MDLVTEFAAPGFARLRPNGLLVPFQNDPRLKAYRREGCPDLDRFGEVRWSKHLTVSVPGHPMLPMIAGGAQVLSYFIQNSAMATTAAPVKQPTGSAIRTMMQLSPQSTAPAQYIHPIEWGCSFDGSAAATPGEIELVDTGTVPATSLSTAYAAADVQKYGNSNEPANTGSTTGAPLALGISNSGFATAAVTEGSTTATRQCDLQMLPPTAPYVKQMPLGKEFEVPGGDFLRLRVTFGTTINMYGYIIFEV